MESYFDGIWLTRLVFQRALAAIYLVGFLGTFNQFGALLGEKGLLPVADFLKRATFWRAPSIFHLHYSDRFLRGVAVGGSVLSVLALLGIPERGPLWASVAAWLLLWGAYLSIVNVGQTFYAFGWESMLVEAGFFAAFLGPSSMAPSVIPIVILRWMLFRVELGAGLIKLRHDPCWRDLTCLYYHYETQPLPNPLSWYFHRLPRLTHRCSAVFSHFVQVITPFGLLAPQPWSSIAGGLLVFHQLLLIISGNYSWLNWLTVALGVTAFSDSVLAGVLTIAPPALRSRPLGFNILLYALAAMTVFLSIKPVLNLFSKGQLMNYSYNPFHLVGSYGAFGDVTKVRYEIVIEGTEDRVITPQTTWKEYEFKAKPGPVKRKPPQVAPYHLRLDWLMWFLPFSVVVADGEVITPGYELWFIRLILRLLEGDRQVISLLRGNPFPEEPPVHVRALFYRYRYTRWKARRETGAWWERTLIGEYIPAARLPKARKA